MGEYDEYQTKLEMMMTKVPSLRGDRLEVVKCQMQRRYVRVWVIKSSVGP